MATITIKTAHGYLSLQPSGAIEFRPHASEWETFIVEGLGGPVTPAPVAPVPAIPATVTSVTATPATLPPATATPAIATPAPATPAIPSDAIDLSRARIPAPDCPDVRHWPVRAPLTLVEFAATERFERGDTMVDFPGRDALPAARGSQGPIAYTLWMGCRIVYGGEWYIAPIVECIRGYVPTGRLLAPNQVATNLFYYPEPPLRGYQPAPGEQIALFCTTGDTRRQNAQVVAPWRTNVVVVPFAVGRYVVG